MGAIATGGSGFPARRRLANEPEAGLAHRARREGLKVPQKQPKRGRLWLNDGSCVRLRPQHASHVWWYNFVADRTQDGGTFHRLTAVDEFNRRSLAIVVARRLRSDDVLHCLTRLFSLHGPEFAARAVRGWLGGWA
jgi:putative transposase